MYKKENLFLHNDADVQFYRFENAYNSSSVYKTADFKFEYIKSSVTTGKPRYHFHDNYEIYYLLSGERYYFINDKTYHVKKGDFVLINSYDVHYTSTVEGFGYERFLINIKKNFLSELSSLYPNSNLFKPFEENIHIIQMEHAEQHIVKNLIAGMIEECNAKKKGYELYVQTLLTQMLLFIYRKTDDVLSKPPVIKNVMHRTVALAIQYINENYNSDITLSSVSEKFFISRFYFLKLFKKNTGFSFSQYINNTRIKEAQILLKNKELSVTEIASSTGFNSITHFSRVFKNIMGISPSDYRKRLSNNESIKSIKV